MEFFDQFVFKGFLGGKGLMFTKTIHALRVKLRNTVLGNLIHSHSFDYTSKPTTPSALSLAQISAWDPTGTPHWMFPVVRLKPNRSEGELTVCPMTQARPWGCLLAPLFPY